MTGASSGMAVGAFPGNRRGQIRRSGQQIPVVPRMDPLAGTGIEYAMSLASRIFPRDVGRPRGRLSRALVTVLVAIQALGFKS